MNKHTKPLQRTLFTLGVTLCLAGALLMVHGSIFGDRTIGIAIVTGIIGIGLISKSHKVRQPKDFSNTKSKSADINVEGR